MKVNIKTPTEKVNINSAGVAFAVDDDHGNHLGDLIVTTIGITWCDGKTDSSNGVKIPWDDFIAWISSG
jgi:hypothetical protein